MPQPPSPLDRAALRRAFGRAAATVAGASFLDREVERRMAERLGYVRLEPRRVLDAGAGTGASLAMLRARYPRAETVAADFAPALVRRARSARPIAARLRGLVGAAPARFVCADLAALPFPAESFGLVWSNLALAFAPSVPAAIAEWRRVLETGGLLMFSTYGPDTLKELRAAFAAADAAPHVHDFVDMHDLGDMLIAAGFADPVMDMEMVTLTYADVGALARDLRDSGQASALAARRRGLTTPRAWTRMVKAYERARRDGRLPATVEVVYGHAWKAVPKASADGRAIIRFDRAINTRR
ncbi:MAG: methyltransferase domain-containing protein [Burkholderiales bacterium]|nr:methyltransferase domain-containing protein [Burkholderiales bacterium]